MIAHGPDWYMQIVTYSKRVYALPNGHLVRRRLPTGFTEGAFAGLGRAQARSVSQYITLILMKEIKCHGKKRSSLVQ
jgi:hypothetical protein